MRKCGRPPKKENPEENKEKIIRAAIAVVEAQGADAITVRRICEKADVAMGTFYYHFQNKDDLMMYFVRGTDFENIDLLVPMSDIAGRITELYLCLIRQYTRLGATFMQSFYNPKNEALHAYMGEKDGTFAAGTVMARCESELFGAREQGFLKKDADIHQMSADICTIVKGCIFEWCLDNGSVDLEQVATRILRFYFAGQFA